MTDEEFKKFCAECEEFNKLINMVIRGYSARHVGSVFVPILANFIVIQPDPDLAYKEVLQALDGEFKRFTKIKNEAEKIAVPPVPERNAV